MAFDHDLLHDGGLRLDVGDEVVTVTMDRPERRNAQTPTTWRAFAHLGEQLGDDVRVVVLRGEGASFSAGLDRRLIDGTGIEGETDIPSLAGLPDEEVLAWVERC